MTNTKFKVMVISEKEEKKMGSKRKKGLTGTFR